MTFDEWFKSSRFYEFWSAWDSPFLMKQAYRAGQEEMRERAVQASNRVSVRLDSYKTRSEIEKTILALPLEGDDEQVRGGD